MEVVHTWAEEFLPTKNMSTEQTRGWLEEFCQALAPEITEMKQDLASLHMRSVAKSLSLVLTDNITDVVVAIQLFRRKMLYGFITAGLLAASTLAQALWALATRQSWFAVLAALVGGKPVYDAHAELTDAPKPPNQVCSASVAMLATRCLDAATECLPQAVWQIYVLLSTEQNHRSSIYI